MKPGKLRIATVILSLTLALMTQPGKVLAFAPQNTPPGMPVIVSPADLSAGVPTGTDLSVTVSDPDGDEMTVTFYGRRKPDATDAFTIVGLPDTQYYTGEKNDGSRDIFYAQTEWITQHLETDNIVFVSQLGDCVESGDLAEDEWKAADTAMQAIEDPVVTNMVEGIPYGIAVGNHDQTPFGDPDGTTALYNAYFGEARFAGRSYYGGHYGTNNDNHYQLFSAGGMDFIVIHLEYDPGASQDVLDWADDLLLAYADRRAIIVSHFLIIFGNPGPFGPQGQAVYDQFKDNSNVFLMLCGHVSGEGRRTDTYGSSTIHTLLSDYQSRPNGGNGWLRLMTFNPALNTISVRTYSPWLDEWETDADSEFDLAYNMDDAGYVQIGSVGGILPDDTASATWPGLLPGSTYEWYAVVDDGTVQVKGPVWSFTTGDHKLDLRVFLEGSWNGETMSGLLSDSIPLEQPYGNLPWIYSGTENIAEVPAGMEDWVLVELRDALSPAEAGGNTMISRFAALLMTDGSIVSPEGGLPGFSQHPAQNLYAVVRHRNHLDILSSQALQNQDGIYSFDFTTGPDKVFGGAAGIKELEAGAWGMVAGDLNGDGIIDTSDRGIWINGSGKSSYNPGDATLDLQTDNRDKNEYWLPNLNRASQVPE